MDILDEVEKDYQEIRRIILFKKLIYIALLIGFISIICIVSYKYYADKLKQNTFEMSNLLFQSEKQNLEESLVTLEAIMKTSKGHVKDLAALKIVQIKFANNNPMEAKNILYNIIIGNYSDITKSYAKLLWVSYNLDNANEDIKDDKLSMQDLFKDIDNKNIVFYGQFNILKALWLLKEKKEDQASETLNQLINLNILPLGLKEVTQTILHDIEIN
jgi:uncharacterized membrane protein